MIPNAQLEDILSVLEEYQLNVIQLMVDKNPRRNIPVKTVNDMIQTTHSKFLQTILGELNEIPKQEKKNG